MQAQDRAYRFGQTRHVSVYRLVAQGTVEELIYMRQVRYQLSSPTSSSLDSCINNLFRRQQLKLVKLLLQFRVDLKTQPQDSKAYRERFLVSYLG